MWKKTLTYSVFCLLLLTATAHALGGTSGSGSGTSQTAPNLSNVTGTLPVANGGTNCQGTTTVGDTNTTLSAAHCTTATSATLTAARTWTLPAANTLTAGQSLCVSDSFGGVSTSFPLTVASAGSDTVDLGTTYILSSPNKGACFKSDGTSVWTTDIVSGVPSPASLVSSIPVTGHTFNCTPQNLKFIRKCIANVRSNTAQCFLLAMGDSVTYGQYSNAGTNTGDLMKNSYPSQLSDLLNQKGTNANSNSFFGASSSVTRSTTDPRLTFGGSWTVNSSSSIGGKFLSLSNQSTSDTLGFLPTANADTAKILYITSSSAATFSAKFNSGSATNTAANGADGFGFVTITSTAPAANTVNINYVSGTSKIVFIQGIITYNSQQASVNIINAGWGGSTTDTSSIGWNNAAAAYSVFNVIPAANQDGTLIKLGINDCNSGTTVAAYKSNMQALITQALTANSGSTNIILLSFNPVSNGTCTQALQQSYTNALYQLAASNDLCLIDNYARYGSSYTTANTTLGWMGNSLHPNQLGYADEAQSIYKVIGEP